MDKLQVKAAIAGICFGLYPLLLSRSRLPGNISCAVFTLIVFICVSPFAVGEISNLRQTRWVMLIGSGIASSIGMLAMTGFLSRTPAGSVGLLIVLMTVTQTIVTATYQVVMDKGISLTVCLVLLSLPLRLHS